LQAEDRVDTAARLLDINLKKEVKPMVRKRLLTVTMALLMVLVLTVGWFPVLAAPVAIINVADTYTIRCSMPVRYLNGTTATRITSGTLVISDNTTTTKGVITNATLTVSGATVAVVGFVGAGSSAPRISLIGSDGNVVVNINGYVKVSRSVIQYISGRADGWLWHTGGELGNTANATSAYSAADSYNGSTSVLLTQGATAGSTYVQVTPTITFHVHDLDSIVSGWSLAHKLQTSKSNGAQIELRFTAPTNVNPDGAGHVDVTLLPYQQVGTGAWVVSNITSATECLAYGNDPWDGTAFSIASPVAASAIEAAINATAEMQANSSNASNWVLSRVRVEVWEGGARTCYVDDLTVGGTVYGFEPVQFAGAIVARP
jgi:hypothetical protein